MAGYSCAGELYYSVHTGNEDKRKTGEGMHEILISLGRWYAEHTGEKLPWFVKLEETMGEEKRGDEDEN